MNENFKGQALANALNLEGGPISAAPAASATVVRSKMDLYTAVTTPATGVGVLQFPYAAELLLGVLYHAKCISDGGGEVKLVDPDGTDMIGDNLGALNDEVVFFSNGQFIVILVNTTN